MGGLGLGVLSSGLPGVAISWDDRPAITRPTLARDLRLEVYNRAKAVDLPEHPRRRTDRLTESNERWMIAVKFSEKVNSQGALVANKRKKKEKTHHVLELPFDFS